MIPDAPSIKFILVKRYESLGVGNGTPYVTGKTVLKSEAA